MSDMYFFIDLENVSNLSLYIEEQTQVFLQSEKSVILCGTCDLEAKNRIDV